ncbi:MAG: hypothetical protein RLZZ113_1137, partial [Pseudomonadota bacterium]
PIADLIHNLRGDDTTEVYVVSDKFR